MNRKIKQCKGFEESICRICKRQNDNAELLVKSLSVKGENKVCQYFIK